jgi:putative oxidoreductase
MQLSNMAATYIVIELVGRAMIAFLFLFQGFNAILKFDAHSDRLRQRNVPLPQLMLTIGLISMFVGGGMILFKDLAAAGAGLLIGFTVVATFLYHNFWSTSDPNRRGEKRNSFLSNAAVIGGLLLVLAHALNPSGFSYS